MPIEVVDLPVGDEIRGAHLVVDAVGQQRGEDLGGVAGAGAADGEAAALELRADLLLHRCCGCARSMWGSTGSGAASAGEDLGLGEREQRVGRDGPDGFGGRGSLHLSEVP